jgi:hypothetical protein
MRRVFTLCVQLLACLCSWSAVFVYLEIACLNASAIWSTHALGCGLWCLPVSM